MGKADRVDSWNWDDFSVLEIWDNAQAAETCSKDLKITFLPIAIQICLSGMRLARYLLPHGTDGRGQATRLVQDRIPILVPKGNSHEGFDT